MFTSMLPIGKTNFRDLQGKVALDPALPVDAFGGKTIVPAFPKSSAAELGR